MKNRQKAGAFEVTRVLLQKWERTLKSPTLTVRIKQTFSLFFEQNNSPNTAEKADE